MQYIPDSPSARRRLGIVLYALAWSLGVAELGIMSRASEWLSYDQLGTLTLVYFLGLFAGVAIAGRLRLRATDTVGLAVLLAAVPIVGIGILLVALGSGHFFALVCGLWAISGIGAGVLDNAHATQAVHYSTGGRTDSVAMLAWRHIGTLSASALTMLAIAGGVGFAWQYMALGVLLIIPLVGRRLVPDVPKVRVASGTRSAWILVPLGLFLGASVLPTTMGWGFIVPVMVELEASRFIGSLALSGFVVAQAAACILYFRRSKQRTALRLVVEGAAAAVAGVVLLAPVAMHVVSPVAAPWLAACALALLGWGVAPLPMVVAQAVLTLPLRLETNERLSRVVMVQCLLLAGGGRLVGIAADHWSGAATFAGAGALCVIGILIGILWLRRNQPSKPASA